MQKKIVQQIAYMCQLVTIAGRLVISRSAESQGWARGQLKYHTSLVLSSLKKARKMPQFSPDFQVISKKKKKSVRSKMALFSPNFKVNSK